MQNYRYSPAPMKGTLQHKLMLSKITYFELTWGGKRARSTPKTGLGGGGPKKTQYWVLRGMETWGVPFVWVLFLGTPPQVSFRGLSQMKYTPPHFEANLFLWCRVPGLFAIPSLFFSSSNIGKVCVMSLPSFLNWLRRG